AVLHGAAGIHELRLPVHRRRDATRDPTQPDQRRPSDDVEYAFVGLLVPGHQGSSGTGGDNESLDGRWNCTGRRTRTATLSFPRRAGSKRSTRAPSTAAESNAAYPLVCSTRAESTVPVAETWISRTVSPSIPASQSSSGYWNADSESCRGGTSGAASVHPVTPIASTPRRIQARVLIFLADFLFRFWPAVPARRAGSGPRWASTGQRRVPRSALPAGGDRQETDPAGPGRDQAGGQRRDGRASRHRAPARREVHGRA